MTTPLREALTQRINRIGPARPAIEELVGLGEQRLRRRRLTAAAGAGTAVALAIGLAIGGFAWNRSADEKPGPIDHPTNLHQTRTTTRPLVYSDDVEYTYHGKGDGLSLTIHVGTVHVGDHEVDIDQIDHRGWDLVVTDAGVLYSNDDANPWFSDGRAPHRIPVCGGDASAGSSGSLVMWFDCERDLVVFDTASGEEVARKSLPSCWVKGWWCVTDSVVGEHAYFTKYGVHRSTPELLYRFDVSSSEVVRATDQMYADDLRSEQRALVLGDSWRTGAVAGELDLAVVGSRLVPYGDSGTTNAFDAATGRPVHLRLPSDYAPGPLPDFNGDEIPGSSTSFHQFEWLDDDTVALVQGDYFFGDILTCHLSDGRCRLAVPGDPTQLAVRLGAGRRVDHIRMVPGMPFPE